MIESPSELSSQGILNLVPDAYLYLGQVPDSKAMTRIVFPANLFMIQLHFLRWI